MNLLEFKGIPRKKKTGAEGSPLKPCVHQKEGLLGSVAALQDLRQCEWPLEAAAMETSANTVGSHGHGSCHCQEQQPRGSPGRC